MAFGIVCAMSVTVSIDSAGRIVLPKALRDQFNLRPVTRQFRRRLRQPLARSFQRCRIFIEANQMTLCAEVFCHFPTMST